MAKKMMSYLVSQPAVWNEIFARRAELLAGFRKAMADRSCKQVLMIGSGSSYNAACAAASCFEDLCGIQVIACAPTRADAMLALCTPADTVVILISQSGASTSTIAVVERVKARGFFAIGLTQRMDSRVAAASDLAVELACGEETVGPKTKGYTATVLTLQLMALCLCRDAEKVKEVEADLVQAFAQAPAIIEASAQWAKQHSQQLCSAPHMMVLGEGCYRPAMQEAALKLLECLYIPVTDYEFEEYLHGVQCAIGPGSHLLLAVPDNHNRERMLRLAEFNEQHGGVSYIFSTQRATTYPGELFVPADASPYTACYHILLPFQVVSAIVSEDKGINCDLPKFPTFVHDLKTKNWQ